MQRPQQRTPLPPAAGRSKATRQLSIDGSTHPRLSRTISSKQPSLAQQLSRATATTESKEKRESEEEELSCEQETVATTNHAGSRCQNSVVSVCFFDFDSCCDPLVWKCAQHIFDREHRTHTSLCSVRTNDAEDLLACDRKLLSTVHDSALLGRASLDELVRNGGRSMKRVHSV